VYRITVYCVHVFFVVFFAHKFMLFVYFVPDGSILVFLTLHYHKIDGIVHRVHKYDP
jgi:hypothetical protein